MADIKGIKTEDPDFFQRAKDLSSKYDVPLIGPEFPDIHINLDNPSVLHFNGMKLVNSFKNCLLYTSPSPRD